MPTQRSACARDFGARTGCGVRKPGSVCKSGRFRAPTEFAHPQGLDALILFPEIADVRQVEQLATAVLPAYR
jgi:hypothetical protein